MFELIEVLPNSFLGFTGLWMLLVWLVLFFTLLTIGLSDNFFSARSRNGIPWREYYISRVVSDKETCKVFISDANTLDPKVAFRNSRVRNLLLKIISSMKMESVFNGTVFSEYAVNLDILFSSFFIIYIHKNILGSYVKFPFDVVFLSLALIALRNAFYYRHVYFSLSIVQCGTLYACTKKMFKKTNFKNVNCSDLSTVVIKPYFLFYPKSLYKVILSTKNSGSDVVLSCSSVVDFVLFVSEYSNVKLYISKWDKCFLGKSLYSTIRKAVPSVNVEYCK